MSRQTLIVLAVTAALSGTATATAVHLTSPDPSTAAVSDSGLLRAINRHVGSIDRSVSRNSANAATLRSVDDHIATLERYVGSPSADGGLALQLKELRRDISRLCFATAEKVSDCP